MTRAEAESAIRNGAIAGFISGGLTLLVVALALALDFQGDAGIMNSPLLLFDVALIFALAEGIRRRSRAAAVVLLVYFVLSKILICIKLGRLAGIPLALVFFYFFARAVQGTFVYHQIRRERNPRYRAAPLWTYYVGIPAGLALFAVMVFMILSELGQTPGTAVVTGDKMSQTQIELLRSKGILLPDEEIVLFYSAGLTSILEDGNVLTNRRVISYQTLDEELETASAEYSEIAAVSLANPGGTFEDAQILVTTVGGAEFTLLVSTEEKGDQRFLAILEARRKAAAR